MRNGRSANLAPAASSAGGVGSIAFAALRHRDYRAYFAFSWPAMLADNIEHVITYWILWEAFHSPLLAGFTVISHWAPFLLFSVSFGLLADRFDCRRLIQASQAISMCLSLTWGVLFFTGGLQVWHAVILLIVHGMAGSLSGPAVQMIVHDIVGREHLASAVRLTATIRQVGILLGPGIGAGLMILLGPGPGIMINALLYLPLITWLVAAPVTGHRREGALPAQGRGIGWAEAVRALRDLSGNRPIMAMVALGGLSSLLVGNAFQAQMPQFARDLGADNGKLAYSALLAANAAGALAGGLFLEGMGLLRPRARSAVLLAMLWCLAIGGFAAAPNYAVALATLFLAGVFNISFTAMAQTIVQLEAPLQMRGRAIGLFNMSNMGLRVGSGVTVGVVGSFVGIHWSLGASSLALLVIGLGLLVYTLSTRTSKALSEA